jgi:hypothetical protein
MSSGSARLDIGLLHHPVLNKAGEVIGSAVTNLDLHDIARAARTYGVGSYYVATPYEDQHGLVSEIIGHWRTGPGATYNPARKEALSIIRLAYSLDDIVEKITKKKGKRPLLVATSARQQPGALDYRTLRTHLDEGETPVLLLFGTAHGLAPEVMGSVDATLLPIHGNTAYNHLSVRSAVSIILDRLLGKV